MAAPGGVNLDCSGELHLCLRSPCFPKSLTFTNLESDLPHRGGRGGGVTGPQTSSRPRWGGARVKEEM